MISRNPESNCMNAQLYYYDFLSKETRAGIPESALEHIIQCLNCQAEMDKLKVLLAKADERIETEQSRKNSAITALLRLHFAHIGEPLKCNTVKLFLASLADPVLQIQIPTPITVHIDKCQACCDDLLTLRDLHLTHEQLFRLGRLLEKKPDDDTVSCSQAQTAILAVVFMAFRETNAEVLRHLCICPDCRKSLYEYRENVCKDLDSRIGQGQFPCESVSATDIFDYVVPYGIDPANDQYAKFRESLISHLRSCRTCLAKMQELHQTIYNITERAESEVVTIYHIDESAKAQAISESDELYAGFPIRVETPGRENRVNVEQPGAIIDFTARLKHKVSVLNVKAFLKTGIAAAAVILIGLALLLNAPSAKAVTIEQIYTALENVKNVYIATFDPNKTEPLQERWVSRTLNIYMSKAGKELVLRHIPNRIKKVKDLDTDLVETRPMSTEMVTEIEKTISEIFGLLPFTDISDIPPGAELNILTDDALQVNTEGIEVYDLTWTEKTYDGSEVFFKWRFFVEPKTNLPQRAESYRKLTTDSEYNLKIVMIVEYLSDGKIEAIFKEASF